ncbi:hypothetical protein B0H11DRAFT_1313069 [Mycena galericulata]|nr:hypothetical protein B0H11DRAFT_1313069 [Mycena galericulata]
MRRARTMPPILMEGSWIAHPPMLPSSGADLFIHPLLSPTFLIPAISRAFLLQRVSDGGVRPLLFHFCCSFLLFVSDLHSFSPPRSFYDFFFAGKCCRRPLRGFVNTCYLSINYTPCAHGSSSRIPSVGLSVAVVIPAARFFRTNFLLRAMLKVGGFSLCPGRQFFCVHSFPHRVSISFICCSSSASLSLGYITDVESARRLS